MELNQIHNELHFELQMIYDQVLLASKRKKRKIKLLLINYVSDRYILFTCFSILTFFSLFYFFSYNVGTCLSIIVRFFIGIWFYVC